MEQIKACYPGTALRLSVATFNQRAIQLYKNLGFTVQDTFSANSNEFITMIKKNE